MLRKEASLELHDLGAEHVAADDRDVVLRLPEVGKEVEDMGEDVSAAQGRPNGELRAKDFVVG
eukprot:2746188-Lingulodinium_polyedra.AAC.1